MRDEAQGVADEGEPEEMDAEEADDNAFAVTSAEPAGISSGAVARPIGRGLQVPSWAMGNPVTKWLAECVIELLKVTWPTRREAWNLTVTVIVMSAVVAAILFAVDLGLQQVLSWIVSLGAH